MRRNEKICLCLENVICKKKSRRIGKYTKIFEKLKVVLKLFEKQESGSYLASFS